MSSFRSLVVLVLFSVLALTLLGSSSGCGPSCSAGYYYLQLPNFNFSSNGCGSYGVEVSAPFGANPCCDAHDYCYSNCSTTKSTCDSTFDQCLTTACGTQDDGVDQAACKVQAHLFYDAVMGLGCPAYTSAQDSACECSTSSNFTGNYSQYYFNSATASAGSSMPHIVAALSCCCSSLPSCCNTGKVVV